MKTKSIFSSILALAFCTSFAHSQLKVFQNGNVSIGGTTTLPWPAKLQVAGNSVFSQTQGTITSSAYIRGLNNYSTQTTPDYTWFNNDQTGIFHPSNNVIGFTISGAEKMRIHSDGRLRIGTLYDYGGLINTYSYDIKAYVADAVHTQDWMQGIVTKLNRAAGVTYVVNYNGTDNFYVMGNGIAAGTGFYTFSDSRLKENVVTISGALDKVLQLRGVNFRYIKPTNVIDSNVALPNEQFTEIGLIAQEVEKIVPEAVRTVKDGFKAVGYPQLIGLLIEAIKEQNSEIEELKLKVNELNGLNNNQNSNNLDDLIAKNPNRSYLLQNTPNPFNHRTIIQYYIAGSNMVNSSLMVFDMQGLLKKSIPIGNTGRGSIDISASEFPAGMYIYSLLVNDVEIDTKKMILTK